MGKPKGWVAVLLALVAPGAGLLYAGNGRVAVGFAVVPGVALVGVLGAAALLAPVMLMPAAFVLLLLWVVAWCAQVGWSLLEARRVPAPTRRARWWTIVLFVVLSTVLPRALAYALRFELLESFIVSSEAMTPSLLQGDQVFVVKRGRFGAWSRGDVVVGAKSAGGLPLIKRVVALEGDRVEYDEGQLVLNDVPLALRDCEPARPWCAVESLPDGRSWQVLRGARGAPAAEQGEGVYVLGDNRDNSSDSRDLGRLPRELVVGRAVVIWFSWSRESGLRWARIGTAL